MFVTYFHIFDIVLHFKLDLKLKVLLAATAGGNWLFSS